MKLFPFLFIFVQKKRKRRVFEFVFFSFFVLPSAKKGQLQRDQRATVLGFQVRTTAFLEEQLNAAFRVRLGRRVERRPACLVVELVDERQSSKLSVEQCGGGVGGVRGAAEVEELRYYSPV